MRSCTVAGCPRPYRCSGLCDVHYRRKRRHGETGPPGPIPRPEARSPEELFWRSTDRGGDRDCWRWRGALNRWGYGYLKAGDRTRSVHRFAYELIVGPIPTGLQIDHLCRHTWCVNPAHMEPVTPAEHNVRTHGRKNERTHCPQGHEFSAENTYIIPSSGSQACRTCIRERQRRYQQRKAEKLAREMTAQGTHMT